MSDSTGRVAAIRVGDVDLPEPLIEAHADGRLALFVGAGASSDPPASLPDFKALAGKIASRTIGSHLNERDPARLLDRLQAEHEINVHAEIRKVLTEAQPEPNATHEAIVRLALSAPSGQPRIVTTNYDTLLSQLLPTDTRTYEYPDLPGRGDFTGVVYLHGSLKDARGGLVATDSHLADAYMGTRAVGTLFLERLFDKCSVLFVGYSLDDVLVRYLLKAHSTTSKLYTLTTRPDDPRWRELRVCPVGYESHSQLPAILSRWADHAEAGIAGEDQRVGVIVAAGPPPVEYDDLYLREVLQDPHRVGLFAGRAQDARWLRWVASTLHPGLVFTQAGDLTESQHQLQAWFARCFATDDDPARAALELIGDSGSVMPLGLWRQMMWSLRSRRCGVSSDLKRRLLVAMTDAAPAAGGDLLLEVIEDCQAPDDDSLVLELFARVHSPRMRDPEQRSLRVLHLEPGTDMLERFRHLAADLSAIADQRLRQDARRDDLLGRYRRSRPAVEAHPQNDVIGDPDRLVDAARDLLDFQIQDAPEAATAQLRAWEESRWTILQRLALYGHTVRGDLTPDAKLAVLVECPDLFVDRELHHEAMHLIAAALPAASPSVVDQLVAAVCDHETSNRIRFHKLAWIAHHAAGSRTAQAAFHAEQAAQPNLQMSEHPDFLQWVEITTTSEIPDYHRADLPNLAALILDDPPAALELIVSHYTDPGTDTAPSPRWFDALRCVQAVTEEDLQACLSLLEALASFQSPHMEAVALVASTALASLDKAVRQDDTLRESTNIRRLCVRLWRAATDRWPQPEPGTRERDWTQAAANSCAGQLARLFLLTIKPRQPQPGEADATLLRAGDTLMLRVMLKSDTAASHHAQNVCAQHLWWLHSLDRHGVGRHVLASLDPTTDQERAVRFWEGYLYHPRWSHEMIEDGLTEHLVAFAPHVNGRSRDPREGFAHLTTGLSLYSTAQPLDPQSPWLNRLTVTASEPTRVRFIQTLGHELSNLPPHQRQQHWDRWVNRYLTNRANGEPTPLSPKEATATAAAGAQMGDLFPAVVDIVVLTQAPLAPEQIILLLLTHTDRDDTEPSIAERHPHTTAQLLAHMLAPPTQRADLAAWESTLWDAYRLLDQHGAVTPELEQQMTRLDVRPPAA